MKPSRLLDLIVVIAVIASGAYLWRRPEAPLATPSPVPRAASRSEDVAASFQLPRVQGEVLNYPAGQGPALITLSAVGCAGCRDRVGLDRQAYEKARQHKIPVWNIFVYANADAANAFQSQLHPAADEFLYDVDGHVAVGTYRGSDNHCWILIDSKGRIAYRGAAHLPTLEPLLQTAASDH